MPQVEIARWPVLAMAWLNACEGLDVVCAADAATTETLGVRGLLWPWCIVAGVLMYGKALANRLNRRRPMQAQRNEDTGNLAGPRHRASIYSNME